MTCQISGGIKFVIQFYLIHISYHSTSGPSGSTSGGKLKKLVKLTLNTYASNDLTNFEYAAHAVTGNGSYMNMQKLVLNKALNL